MRSNSTDPAHEKRLRERIKLFYRRLTKHDWDGCFQLLDPRLREHGTIARENYTHSLAAFVERIGALSDVTIADVRMYPEARSASDTRAFAYATVHGFDPKGHVHALQERWIRAADRQWYTRRVGFVPVQCPANGEDDAPSVQGDVPSAEADTPIRDVPKLVHELFRTVEKLNGLYPRRPFTPDGHLIGSIGEVVAAHTYGLEIERRSNQGFGARTTEGHTVKVALTGGTSVAVPSDFDPPALLIVLKLDERQGFVEVYNGRFPVELWQRKRATRRRTKSLTVNELQRLNPKQLHQEHPLESLNELFRNTARG